METNNNQYIAKLDSKKRITIRHPIFEYYRVTEKDNGVIILEPRELIDPFTISKKSLESMDEDVDNLKKGIVSEPIELK